MKNVFRVFYIMMIALILSVAAVLPVMGEEAGYVDSLIRENTGNGSLVEETPLGRVTAEIIRSVCDTDVAIVNGCDLLSNLQPGRTAREDLDIIYPADTELAVCLITSAKLWELLEYGLSHVVVGVNEKTDKDASEFDGFPQCGGIQFTYDLSAPAGERLSELSLADGTRLRRYDTDTEITMCASVRMLSGGYGYEEVPFQTSGMSLSDAVWEYLQHHSITDRGNHASRSIGTFDTPLVSRSAILVIAFALIIMCVCLSKVKIRSKKENEIF